MRFLVLGAGALGGYFGGRLMQGGADVTFLVREKRAAQLARDGLVIESPLGAAKLPVATVTADTVGPGWDVILLSCKAYDLDSAIAAIRPAVDGRSAIVPVLNGLSHIEVLQGAFGADRVLGGLARIFASLTPEGVVRHTNPFAGIAFGELRGGLSDRVRAIGEAFAKVEPPGSVTSEASADIRTAMWEKLAFLHAVAASTVMLRGNIGEIVRAGGAALMRQILERNAAIAAAEGYPLPEGYLGQQGPAFANPKSNASASMLRDLEQGNLVEADHILGFVLEAARRAGIDDTLHAVALLHAKTYEQRRAANRLSG